MNSCHSFFFYGTLLPGQSRWPLVERLNGVSLGWASTTGWLLNLGEYPGLVAADWFHQTSMSIPHTTGVPVVHGLAVQFPDLDNACRVLDAEEDCHTADLGFDPLGQPIRSGVRLNEGLYVRRLQRITLSNGHESWAWTYHYNHTVNSPAWIESGSWLRAQG